ncbi:hypothetical protein QTP70_002735 [Hemibagrus guttatus]|uniref:Uncharacterized protein n=1 Tax=Hemibagrus guttatus TaxID=175788 RepID=A0AAE0Q8T2_9TELE|nr:hypothetical protein QTP70_002735 [Hemibagrus guttatus]
MDPLGSSQVPQENFPTPVELALLLTDGIFGFTTHLLKRKQKVIEGLACKESPHYGGLDPMKKLHSADEIQHGRRPNPEGAGSVTVRELSTGRACQRCHILTNQLNRQALALAESGSLKVGPSH